jgi:hypothetical protein
MIDVVAPIAGTVIVVALIAHNAAVRWFADRADARVKRVAECEVTAASAERRAIDVEKRFGELEKRMGALMGRPRRA